MKDKKFQKKKERERRVYDKMLKRRLAIRRFKKSQVEEEREKMKYEPKQVPYRKESAAAELLAKLEENAKMLKALEEEYEKECGSRVNLGEEALKQLEELDKKFNPVAAVTSEFQPSEKSKIELMN